MSIKWLSLSLSNAVNDVLDHLQGYHDQFYKADTFTGPSLHFHRRALEESDLGKKAELIYAALTSWGMHRMGPSGSKMKSFEIFKVSLLENTERILELCDKIPFAVGMTDWDEIEKLFRSIDVMRSGTKIVGNSKVMAHLIPQLIAPVDREYTLQYLFGSKNLQNDIDKEWLLLRKIHEEFYYPVILDPRFDEALSVWSRSKKQAPWDTSSVKLVDNLVIGAIRLQKQQMS